jgi:hypothetical protein
VLHCGLRAKGSFTKRGGVLLDNMKVLDVVPGAVVQIVTALKTLRAKKVVLAPGLHMLVKE